ncbi:MAG: trigger factor [Micromonosporaceae bacterium]|nr:trigger factor [Micromonosporaceae bacterium]
MKSTVETLSPTRVRLEVEVPFVELEPSVKQAYRAIGAQVNVPGFRKGKVPAAIIDQRIGRAAVLQEAVQTVVPEKLRAAVTEHDVKTIGRPEVELDEVVDGQPLKFTVEVDVRPELVMPDLASIEVPIATVEVTDEDVEQQLTSLRERFATLKTAERSAQNGDYVQIDLAATVDGLEVEGGSATNISHEVGSGQLVPGLDDVLIGLSASESTTFVGQLLGGDHAGKDADISVTVRSVKEKCLPELDDDFAQLASEFDTLEEIRADLRNRLERSKNMERLLEARDKALAALVAAAEVPAPESVVRDEVDQRKLSMVAHLQQMGATLSEYLATESRTEEELDKELHEAAGNAVKVQLVLDQLADAEKIAVSNEEFGAEILDRARQAGQAPEQYYQRLVQEGSAGTVFGEVRRGKALALLLERVRIVDADGNEVSVKSLREAIVLDSGHDHDHDHDHED